jgi:hypothetical protein
VTVAPLFAPGVNDTLNEPVAPVVATATAFTFAGAAGEPTITGSDAVDARPAPREFVAFTVHAYVFPGESALTTSGLAAPVFVRETPPLLETHDAK